MMRMVSNTAMESMSLRKSVGIAPTNLNMSEFLNGMIKAVH